MKTHYSEIALTWQDVKDWSRLEKNLRRFLVDVDIRASGMARVSHVRVDVPPLLAEQPGLSYAPLTWWLQKYMISFQIFASARNDVFVQVFFKSQPS